MDREMPAPAPEIDLLVSGRKVASRLTRRQFLAYLFSYLVIISFLLCFGMISLNIIAPSLDALHSGLADMRFGENVWAFGKIVVVGSILALLSSMLVTTLHGVFFLAEKIHQP
ncbi:MAG: hypothetical protein ACK4YQ_15970 [Phenylobacterium sp.]|uniref:hypothetical protein n=1 Tax=Phenylobacterium sp. TaxID=1871053 RepID=UPI0039190C20